MNNVANTGHFDEQIKVLELLERIALQEQIEKIDQLSSRLNLLRKEKSDALGSYTPGWDKRIEAINDEICKLWEELKQLEKERVKISAHYKEEKQLLKEKHDESITEIINNAQETINADEPVPKRYGRRLGIVK